MSNSFGLGTDTTNFSSTVHAAIQKKVVDTLRAGLVSLPKGAVVPAVGSHQQGENFTLTNVSYPDIAPAAATDPLVEGTAPTALKLNIDTQDTTVQQTGAWTKVTDIAMLQSPHNLKTIAADKIARLAAEKIDLIGQTALAAGATTSALGDTGSALGTMSLLDVLAEAESLDYEAIPGVGFYVVCHPYALRGLKGESGLNGYVQVTAESGGDLTKGAVGQYRGATFLTSTKFTATAGNYPVYVFGANSIMAGDIGSMEYVAWDAAGPGNELRQLSGVGFKGILGAKVLSFANRADGAATAESDIGRVLVFTVTSGQGTL
jgi:N4-gp56 family major capsid protein